MKYMLMMNTTSGGEYQIMSWPKQDIEAHIAFMMDFHKSSPRLVNWWMPRA